MHKIPSVFVETTKTKTALTITFLWSANAKSGGFILPVFYSTRKRTGKGKEKREEENGNWHCQWTNNDPKYSKKKIKMNSNIKPVNFRLIFIEKPFKVRKLDFYDLWTRFKHILPVGFANFYTYRIYCAKTESIVPIITWIL